MSHTRLLEILEGIFPNTFLKLGGITNKDLLYSTGKFPQYFVITYKGKDLNYCAVYLKLTLTL